MARMERFKEGLWELGAVVGMIIVGAAGVFVLDSILDVFR